MVNGGKNGSLRGERSIQTEIIAQQMFLFSYHLQVTKLPGKEILLMFLALNTNKPEFIIRMEVERLDHIQMGEAGGITALKKIIIEFFCICLDETDQFTVTDGLTTWKSFDGTTGIKLAFQLPVEIDDLHHRNRFHSDHHSSSGILGHHLLEPYLTAALLNFVIKHKWNGKCDPIFTDVLNQLFVPGFKYPQRDILAREEKNPQGKIGNYFRLLVHSKISGYENLTIHVNDCLTRVFHKLTFNFSHISMYFIVNLLTIHRKLIIFNFTNSTNSTISTNY